MSRSTRRIDEFELNDVVDRREWRESRRTGGLDVCLRAYQRSARMLPHVRLHDYPDLRHFYASGLIAAGCDIVTVQRALGHSTATTTLNTYSHLWPTAEDRTRKAASGLMRQALKASAGHSGGIDSRSSQ
jgi:integrase